MRSDCLSRGLVDSKPLSQNTSSEVVLCVLPNPNVYSLLVMWAAWWIREDLYLVLNVKCVNFFFFSLFSDGYVMTGAAWQTGCDHISTVWLLPLCSSLPVHFVLFKYINNQKQLINFPSDASQRLLMSEKGKSLASLPPPPCPLPPPLPLPTPFPSGFHFRHTRFTLSDLLNLLLICLSECLSFLSYPSPRPSRRSPPPPPPPTPSIRHSLMVTAIQSDN